MIGFFSSSILVPFALVTVLSGAAAYPIRRIQSLLLRILTLVAWPTLLSYSFCYGDGEWAGFFLLPCFTLGLTVSFTIGLLTVDPPRRPRMHRRLEIREQKEDRE